MRYTPKQYARAVRSAVGTVAEFHKIIDELKAASEVFASYGTVIKCLTSKVVPVDDRVSILERMVGDLFRSDTTRILLLLVRNGQFRELPALVRVASRMVDAEEGVARVSVVTANVISTAVRKNIESAIADRFHGQVNAVYAEDASVLGGLRVIVNESTCWDGTTAGKLKKLAACLAMPTTLQ